MTAPRPLSRHWLFNHRVELASFIGGVGFVFYLGWPDSLARTLAELLWLPADSFARGVYWLLALANTLASALRIWAGGTLGGARMMAVNVQTDRLITAGPYSHVRNPIYLSDIITLAGMSLVVPWPGALMVWTLLALCYPNIIAHEEENLTRELGSPYVSYQWEVPRLAWRFERWSGGTRGGFVWREGIANNFIYLPLVPGFIVAALTGVLWHGVLVGAAGPVGWVVLHFWQNFKPGGLARGNGGDER